MMVKGASRDKNKSMRSGVWGSAAYDFLTPAEAGVSADDV